MKQEEKTEENEEKKNIKKKTKEKKRKKKKTVHMNNTQGKGCKRSIEIQEWWQRFGYDI